MRSMLTTTRLFSIVLRLKGLNQRRVTFVGGAQTAGKSRRLRAEQCIQLPEHLLHLSMTLCGGKKLLGSLQTPSKGHDEHREDSKREYLED